MEEVEMPNSSLVHGEPALSGGVGVGAWAPPDDGEGMDLAQVTDMVVAGDGAWSGVGGLGSGQTVPLGCPDGGGYMSAKARKNAIKNLSESCLSWHRWPVSVHPCYGFGRSLHYPGRLVGAGRPSL